MDAITLRFVSPVLKTDYMDKVTIKQKMGCYSFIAFPVLSAPLGRPQQKVNSKGRTILYRDRL